MEIYEKLTNEQQDKIKDILKVQNNAYITIYQNGNIEITCGIALLKDNNGICQTYIIKNSDIYTQEEIKENIKQLPDFNF